MVMFPVWKFPVVAFVVDAKSDEKKELPPNAVRLKPESARVVFWLRVPPRVKTLVEVAKVMPLVAVLVLNCEPLQIQTPATA